MEDRRDKPLGARIGEAGFCIFYLVFMLIMAISLRVKGATLNNYDVIPVEYYRYSFGFMLAALLFFGDSFHLIPRIIINLRGKMWKEEMFLGVGNLISSITMTIYYNVLIAMGDTLEYDPIEYNYHIEKFILYLTLIRIILLLLPQNKWFTREPARGWAIIRNVPFVIIGILVVIGFINVIRYSANYSMAFYLNIIIMVILSFAFYMSVAIWGREKPKLGMLMIPKTICYIWMIAVIAL